MNYKFVPMNTDYANIIYNWVYSGYMEKIFMQPYFDNFNELTGEMEGPGGCDGYAVLNKDELVGLFEYYFKGEIMEIGLALSPDYVGKGLSKKFIMQGVNFGITNFNYKKDYIKLSVEEDNHAAFKAYLKVGFKENNRSDNEIEMRLYL